MNLEKDFRKSKWSTELMKIYFHKSLPIAIKEHQRFLIWYFLIGNRIEEIHDLANRPAQEISEQEINLIVLKKINI